MNTADEGKEGVRKMKLRKRKIFVVCLCTTAIIFSGFFKVLVSNNEKASKIRAVETFTMKTDGLKKLAESRERENKNIQQKEIRNGQTEFWTYDSYKEWVLEENIELDKLAESGGRYLENGEWAEWTKADSDFLKTEYKKNLKKIKEGYLLAKTSDETQDTSLMIYPLKDAEVKETSSSK